MGLQNESVAISERFKAYKAELNKTKNDTVKEIEVTTIDLKDAASKGDLSENAAYTAAVEKLSMLNVQLANIDTRLQFIDSNISEEEYHPIGMVVDYSTVRLTLNGKEHIFKLYPGDISAIEKGILAMESPLGKAIYLKCSGDVAILEHRITGDPVEYHIEEIY